MRGIFVFTIFLSLITAASADSLLTAQKFPATIADLSFVDRTAILKEGYEPYETIYDAAGNCVEGCVYKGMKLEDEDAFYRRQTAEAMAAAAKIKPAPVITEPPEPVIQTTGEELVQHVILPAPKPTITKTTPVGSQIEAGTWKTPPLPTHIPQVATSSDPSIPSNLSAPSGSGRMCPVQSPMRDRINPTQSVPYGYPLNLPFHINSPYGKRKAPSTKGGSYGSSFHYGIDLRAPDGTPVFSTLRGTVIAAGAKGACGNHVKIKGDDGFAAGYCHLSKILVKKGDRVDGGCVVGLSGNTGNSGGPHLHYIVYDQSNYQINPDKFIRY